MSPEIQVVDVLPMDKTGGMQAWSVVLSCWRAGCVQVTAGSLRGQSFDEVGVGIFGQRELAEKAAALFRAALD